MKKSNILQINNRYIQEELRKSNSYKQEKQRKNRFMGAILVLVVFLFILPTYNLVETYNKIGENETKLIELEQRYEQLTEEVTLEKSLLTKLEDEEYATKYVRARYQYSKEGEIVYNIPGLLPQ